MFSLDGLALAERYAAVLATDGVVRGLIGPHEAPRLWERHLLNCAVLESAIPLGSTVCDVGSGAGLPGLVLAIARPDLRITLVEPLLRRVSFLGEVVEALGLDVEIVRARAEQLHGHRRFDVVTSRALAPFERLLEWSMPLVDSQGAVLAMKGASVADEICTARATLARLGCGTPEVITLGDGVLSESTVAVRVPWVEQAGVSWPTDDARPSPAASPSSRPPSASGGAARER
ncbi:MAG: 16S rRNA (guanine(527)-N(7))-methyltransferase RsmG [Nocardioides sp.]